MTCHILVEKQWKSCQPSGHDSLFSKEPRLKKRPKKHFPVGKFYVESELLCLETIRTGEWLKWPKIRFSRQDRCMGNYPLKVKFWPTNLSLSLVGRLCSILLDSPRHTKLPTTPWHDHLTRWYRYVLGNVFSNEMLCLKKPSVGGQVRALRHFTNLTSTAV